MITNKTHKELLRVGLKLRDQLGGHHFLQAEIGGLPSGKGDGRANSRYVCRDCNVEALIDPEVWRTWVQLIISAPDAVREVLMRKDCG